MNSNTYAIIEIGSTNTNMHVYQDGTLLYEDFVTIEFKKNYGVNKKIIESDLLKLYDVIEKVLEYTKNIHIYGCSVFRSLSDSELEEINHKLKDKYGYTIEVVTQEEEATYTTIGCIKNNDYTRDVVVFIGGGGSIELLYVNNKEIKSRKLYNFGVVDITNKFESLKEDIPTCSFDEVYSYVDELIGEIDFKSDILILAGGDHLFWYNNAQYGMKPNTLYSDLNEPYMISIKDADAYDRDALVTSLDAIKARSTNPLWFNGSRAMKVITNQIAHKVDAKYILPTKINMEDGIKAMLESKEGDKI